MASCAGQHNVLDALHQDILIALNAELPDCKTQQTPMSSPSIVGFNQDCNTEDDILNPSANVLKANTRGG